MPASDIGTVKKSERYIASGSFVRSPSLKAAVGEVGVARKSNVSKARSKSCRDLRADLLRLPVVGVVVAGGERVGAEHDPALDLCAEAARAGALVHRAEVIVRPSRAGRTDAVVAGQV